MDLAKDPTQGGCGLTQIGTVNSVLARYAQKTDITAAITANNANFYDKNQLTSQVLVNYLTRLEYNSGFDRFINDWFTPLYAKVTLTPGANNACNVQYDLPSSSKTITFSCSSVGTTATCPVGYIVAQSNCFTSAQGAVNKEQVDFLRSSQCRFTGGTTTRLYYNFIISCVRATGNLPN